MEVQQEVLELLKCSNCTGYLSSAPVLLTAGGQSVCGRCPAPEEEPATRNQPYELLAQHVAFPCKYQEEGCVKRVAFGKLKLHEDGCAYRKYVCPVVETGACEWLGQRSELVRHCRAEHPDTVINNSHVFRHNITASSVQAYVMSVFNVLFLIHTKVCTTTRKIYHSVRLLGHPEHASAYNFHIDIKKDDIKLTYKGQVAPQGCLYIKEDIAVRTDINSLLGILGGYEGTTFKLTINQVSQPSNTQAKEAKVSNKPTKAPKPVELVKCVTCGACVASPTYRNGAGWHCEACTPPRRPCENNARGCTHSEIYNKMRKHQFWYCEHSINKCDLCGNVPTGSMAAHKVARHPEVVHRAATAWRHTLADNKKNRYVLIDVGVLVCWGQVRPAGFTFCAWSPLSREEMRLYECVVVLEHPTTAQKRRFTATPQYHKEKDWELELTTDEVALYCQGGEINITIDVVKKP